MMPNNRQNIADKKWLPVVFSTPDISRRKKIKARFIRCTKYVDIRYF